MRYATPIYLVEQTQTYNAATGNYDTEETLTKTYASVIGTDIETMRLVYGEIRQGSFTIQTQNKVKFNRVRIGDKLYAVDYVYPKAVKGAYVVSEVQNERESNL